MSSDHHSRSTGRRLFSGAVRLLADALAIGLWIIFLTLLAISIGIPRWLFYVLLLGSIGVYVQLTTSWW